MVSRQGTDPGPVTGVPPGKHMGPVEVLWEGNGVPPAVDRDTPVKTVPSRRSTYAGGKYDSHGGLKNILLRRLHRELRPFLPVAVGLWID